MGRASKTRRAEEKKRKKRAAKIARKLLYASYAGQGRRNKKRASRRKEPSTIKGAHVISNCGNIGCERCFPQFRCARANEIPENIRRKLAV